MALRALCVFCGASPGVRPEYAAAVIDKLLNWDFAAQQLDRARERKAA